MFKIGNFVFFVKTLSFVLVWVFKFCRMLYFDFFTLWVFKFCNILICHNLYYWVLSPIWFLSVVTTFFLRFLTIWVRVFSQFEFLGSNKKQLLWTEQLSPKHPPIITWMAKMVFLILFPHHQKHYFGQWPVFSDFLHGPDINLLLCTFSF